MSNDTASIIANAPADLRTRHHWVVWRYGPASNSKPRKIPYSPRTGSCASSTDPTTWATFEQAIEAYASADYYSGIGYVFSGSDGMAGLDLDDCIREDGSLAPWAQQIVDQFKTYTEISPSERGVKLFFRGRKPAFAGCSVKNIDPSGGELEVYDSGRYFTLTGNRLPATTQELADRQAELDDLCSRYWNPQATPSPAAASQPVPGMQRHSDRASKCLSTMLRMNVNDKGDGSYRLYAVACRCVEHDLSDVEAVQTIRLYAQIQPFPTDWTDAEFLQRVRDAEKKCQRGKAMAAQQEDTKPVRRGIGELMNDYPQLRTPVIEGLLREGETMNVIAPPKTGKSWLVTDLALAVASGSPWLGRFRTTQGKVLIIDNELHGETSANRIPKVAAARGMDMEDIKPFLDICNLRGHLMDLITLGSFFRDITPGEYKIIILDAFYRFLPRDTDENDNGSIAQLYNHIDRYAKELGCCFVLIHHSSKGNQSGKAISDVGSGAGAQSRATDTHLILRAHEQPGAAVLEAAVRSWKPIEPLCLAWTFPVWNPAEHLDPMCLRPERPRRSKTADASRDATPAVDKPKWDVDAFVSAFITTEGVQGETIVGLAMERSLSQAAVKRFLAQAVDARKVYRWTFGANKPVRYSTTPQPLIEAEKSACGQI